MSKALVRGVVRCAVISLDPMTWSQRSPWLHETRCGHTLCWGLGCECAWRCSCLTKINVLRHLSVVRPGCARNAGRCIAMPKFAKVSHNAVNVYSGIMDSNADSSSMELVELLPSTDLLSTSCRKRAAVYESAQTRFRNVPELMRNSFQIG